MITQCIAVRRFDGEVTDITTKASVASDGVSSAGVAMAEGTPETPEQEQAKKPEEVEKKEGEEEKKEGEEAVVEEVEEPDDTPVDLSEFWVKPDQVIFLLHDSDFIPLPLVQRYSPAGREI